MSRSTTLAIVHPVDKLQGSDDAVRTQVWAETTQLLTPMLGKLYARFEPAQKAWRQATYTPLGVVLGRTDPALFLYFFSYGKTVQKESMEFHLSGLNLAYDSQIDAMVYCRRAEELFELYQRCANRRQVETICVNFLRMLESTKLSVNGHLYFVPRHNMEKVDIFEDFVAELSRLSRNQTHLMANSIYIIDDAKQRQKMTEEFYSAVKKEISEYQERADYFIKSGCQSPSVMDRWVLKIQSLEGKKQHYENVLRRELDGLDDDFATLKLLSQELSFRAQTIRAKKAA